MEETATQKPPFLNTVAKDGIILGVIHVIIFFVLYFVLPEYLTGFTYLGFIILLNIGYCILRGNEYRSSLGGYAGFGEAFKYCFMVLVINGLLSSLIVPVLFSSIDSSYASTMAQSQLDTSIYWAEKFGAPENKIDEMREMNIDKMAEQYTATRALIGFGVAIIFYALGSVISSFAVRKNEPEMM